MPSPQVSPAFIFAVAISNISQGMGGTAEMLASGQPKCKITGLWLVVCALSILAALGFGMEQLFSGATGAAADALAADALLVMQTDSIIPQAFEHGSCETALSLVIGFGVAVAVSLLQLG